MKFENVSVIGIENALRGMRNPMMSHARADSKMQDGEFVLGESDWDLAARLVVAGPPHRKFLRQIFVSVDLVKFPAYWLQELQTYKVGTTLDCSSTMHKITSRELTPDDFAEPKTSEEKTLLPEIVKVINGLRESYLKAVCNERREQIFLSIKHLLPSSYLYERATWTANYEVLANVYRWRRNHRLPEWRQFCKVFVEGLPHFVEWIRGGSANG